MTVVEVGNWSVVGACLAVGLVACSTPVASSSGSGTDTGSTGMDTVDSESAETEGPPIEPERGLRLVVRSLTSPNYTHDEGPWNSGYSARVDLVELVDGEVSTQRLVDSVVCHYDGSIRCPVASGSPEGWLVLNHPSAGEVDEDTTVWTFDARALLPAAPSLGRELTLDQAQGPWDTAEAVGERLILSRFSDPGVAWTALDADEPVEWLSAVATRARRIEGTQTITLEGGGLAVFDVETGGQTRLDDPERGEGIWPVEIAADGSRLVFGSGVAAFEVALNQGTPGPIHDLGPQQPVDGAIMSMGISPAGGVAWWDFIDPATAQASARYVGLGGAAPVQPQPLEVLHYLEARWSATTGTLMHRAADGWALSVLDPESSASTLIEPSVEIANWQPCGAGAIVESESDGLWWFGVDRAATRLADSTSTWLCAPQEDYVAYVSNGGLVLRSMRPQGLAAREEQVTGLADGYIGWLGTSADASTLVFLWCPEHVSSWPPMTCPGILGAWDVETATPFVLLDEHYILRQQMGVLELPPAFE